MGLARYQIYGTLPELREKIKKIRERKSKWLRSRLFIRSGPAALPIGNDFNVSLTSSGVTMIELS